MMTEYKGYIFYYHPKFKKEFNKIFKKNKCPSIKKDFKLLYDVLIQELTEQNEFKANTCNRMAGLENIVTLPAFIIKKFRCKKIKKGANSGFRITFLFDKEESRFIFVEIFNKNKKPTPNKDRINNLFKNEIHISNELYDKEEELLNGKT